MEQRPLRPKKSPKVKKIVYIDIETLHEQVTKEERDFIDWLTVYFDVYVVQADEYLYLLRGDYLISPMQYSSPFHGEWLSFQQKDVKDQEKPQMDWQRVKEFFEEIVERGENMGDADYDEILLAMLRSQLHYEDEKG